MSGPNVPSSVFWLSIGRAAGRQGISDPASQTRTLRGMERAYRWRWEIAPESSPLLRGCYASYGARSGEDAPSWSISLGLSMSSGESRSACAYWVTPRLPLTPSGSLPYPLTKRPNQQKRMTLAFSFRRSAIAICPLIDLLRVPFSFFGAHSDGRGVAHAEVVPIGHPLLAHLPLLADHEMPRAASSEQNLAATRSACGQGLLSGAHADGHYVTMRGCSILQHD